MTEDNAVDRLVSAMRAVINGLSPDERKRVLASIHAISKEIADRRSGLLQKPAAAEPKAEKRAFVRCRTDQTPLDFGVRNQTYRNVFTGTCEKHVCRPAAISPRLNIMLEHLYSEVRECLRRADECAKRAKSENNRIVQRDFIDIELHWRKLARSYQFLDELRIFAVQYRQQRGRLSERLDQLKRLAAR